MVVWPRLSFVIGSTSGLAAYLYNKISDERNVHNSWTNTDRLVPDCAKWDHNWDCREPRSIVRPPKSILDLSPEEENAYNKKLDSVRPKITRHIFLIRHGEYLDIGESDLDKHLTEVGRKQAKYTGERLKSLNIKWDRIISSTMTRAQETAQIVTKALGVPITDHCNLIREGAPIPPEPPVGHWKPEASFFCDSARIEAGFRRYFHRADVKEQHDTYTLIIGHGNVIRYFVCRALQFPPEAWLRISLNHGSITWISILPSGRVTLRNLGDSGHIPADLVTHKLPQIKGSKL
ncbi:serine/threonine-protein phosphatase Pgam5, mitochondrial isoform X2 [Condylostylus longicornis]|uniref:serine/threonine-protein phosphatase Pgam5, mitochondrial isoform X2 n=1 Tax=Condylostylus longicornis TaxID=2530218 RepID=UPI00244E209A|nr:serine/threonine-protein phosphatase Pgam5, mitochondrial isoform X2 [Condylostylus longicornis]